MLATTQDLFTSGAPPKNAIPNLNSCLRWVYRSKADGPEDK